METSNPCLSPLSLPADDLAIETAPTRPWNAALASADIRAKARAVRHALAMMAGPPVLDRCVIALTVITAASLAFQDYAAPSHSRELLPMMVVTSAP